MSRNPIWRASGKTPLGTAVLEKPKEGNGAIVYVDDNMAAWKTTPGALKWLAENVK